MSTWTRTMLVGAIALAGCEHKNNSAPAKTDTAAKTDTPAKPDPTAPTDGTKPAGTIDPAPTKPALPSAADTVREPVAEDLAEYVKDLPGTGTKILAEIKTTEGTFHCELFGDKVPRTVANWVGLATGKKAWKSPKGEVMKNTPFYDGLTFHRVIPTFMIQGGDPEGTGGGGPGYDIAEETLPDLVHEAGTMSMAKTSEPHSTGSQFFIMEKRNPGLDGGYSVFGKCKEVDLVKKITALRGPGDRPTKEVKIEKVTISKGE